MEKEIRPFIEKLARRVIRKLLTKRPLNEIPDGYFGEVRNLWEEYVVQLQGDQSQYFALYENEVEIAIQKVTEDLKGPERMAAKWIDSLAEQDIDNDEQVFYRVLGEINSIGGGYSNKRIRGYLGEDY